MTKKQLEEIKVRCEAAGLMGVSGIRRVRPDAIAEVAASSTEDIPALVKELVEAAGLVDGANQALYGGSSIDGRPLCASHMLHGEAFPTKKPCFECAWLSRGQEFLKKWKEGE